MKKFLLFLCVISALMNVTANAFASEEFETSNMDDVIKKAQEMGKKYGVKNTLVVFDIDNTVLTMKGNLGSDQWFSWQSKLFGTKECAKFCVAKNFGQLLDVQGMLFSVAPMEATEKGLPKKIHDLQDKGYKVILLTSRGHEFRDDTQRELKKAGFDFSKTPVGTKAGYGSTYKPYQLSNLAKYGLTKKDAEVAKLKKPRSVSYQNGLYMTAGQNKGIMLKTLLHKTGEKFKAIVFADDHKKHTTRMQAIFKDAVDLATFRYSRIDKRVKEFKDSDKKKVHQNWTKLNNTLEAIF